MMPPTTLPTFSSTKFIPQWEPESGSCFFFFSQVVFSSSGYSTVTWNWLFWQQLAIVQEHFQPQAGKSDGFNVIAIQLYQRFLRVYLHRNENYPSEDSVHCETPYLKWKCLFHLCQSMGSGTEDHWDGRHHTQRQSFHVILKWQRKLQSKPPSVLGGNMIFYQLL